MRSSINLKNILLLFLFFVVAFGVFQIADVNAQSTFTSSEPSIVSARGNLPQYISAIYQVGVRLVISLAILVMMWGGLMWIMAGGNTGRIDNAKNIIYSSVLGLVIALSSWVLLNTINPQLVNFSISQPVLPGGGGQQICCKAQTGSIIQIQAGSCKDKNRDWITVECNAQTLSNDPFVSLNDRSNSVCQTDNDCISVCPFPVQGTCTVYYLICSEQNNCVTAPFTADLSSDPKAQAQCSNQCG